MLHKDVLEWQKPPKKVAFDTKNVEREVEDLMPCLYNLLTILIIC